MRKDVLLAILIALPASGLPAGEPAPDLDPEDGWAARSSRGGPEATPRPLGKVRSPYRLKVSSLGGVYDLRLLSPDGAIRVTVPSGLAPGDPFSGRVELSATAEKSKRLRFLEKHRLAVAGREILLARGAWSATLPASVPEAGWRVGFLSPKGKVLAEVEIPVAEPTATTSGIVFDFPRVARVGRPLVVFGLFDGDLRTTSASLGDTAAEILGESPRRTTISLPALKQPGEIQLRLAEWGVEVVLPVQVFDLALAASTASLHRGDRATLELRLTGLQSLDESFEIELVNTAPEIAALSGGDRRIVAVEPAGVRADGSFVWTDGIQARRRGSALFTAEVVSPPIELGEGPRAPQLVVRSGRRVERLEGQDPPGKLPDRYQRVGFEIPFDAQKVWKDVKDFLRKIFRR